MKLRLRRTGCNDEVYLQHQQYNKGNQTIVKFGTVIRLRKMLTKMVFIVVNSGYETERKRNRHGLSLSSTVYISPILEISMNITIKFDYNHVASTISLGSLSMLTKKIHQNSHHTTKFRLSQRLRIWDEKIKFRKFEEQNKFADHGSRMNLTDSEHLQTFYFDIHLRNIFRTDGRGFICFSQHNTMKQENRPQEALKLLVSKSSKILLNKYISALVFDLQLPTARWINSYSVCFHKYSYDWVSCTRGTTSQIFMTIGQVSHTVYIMFLILSIFPDLKGVKIERKSKQGEYFRKYSVDTAMIIVRMMLFQVEYFVLRFFNYYVEPFTQICGDHVHQSESSNNVNTVVVDVVTYSNKSRLCAITPRDWRRMVVTTVDCLLDTLNSFVDFLEEMADENHEFLVVEEELLLDMIRFCFHYSFVNDLPNSLSLMSSMNHMFADDVQLYKHFKEDAVVDSVRELNDYLRSVCRWARENTEVPPNVLYNDIVPYT
ncbi:hypothetical protein Bhyg_11401 [Pseudolycoriella hygida]|uniref:Uncharacterized protein n=1 Tax=Pseudolycoriella hygida TaxID=35572 RepID=A0A9Q0MWV9_9DIPT|nr:hypothetical protein Bhyg_11401 [Pseudolycoriella hygida]